MTISGEQALARVRASLGRDPQDCHEATIALEASGLAGMEAHELGDRAARLANSEGRRSPLRSPDPHRLSWEGPASVGLLLVALLWASMVTSGGGGRQPDGVLIGLPLGLALVGYLDRRFLSGEEGPMVVRSHAAQVLATIGVPCLVFLVAPGGAVGFGVVLMLLCGAFAARLGKASQMIVVIVACFLTYLLVWPSEVMAVISLAASVGLVVAELFRLPRTKTPPARLGFGLTRGAAGLGLGLLTVPIIVHASSSPTTPAMIVVVPSAIGGALAASVLYRMWIVVPDLLESLPAGHRPDRRVGAVYTRLVSAGLIVAVVTTAALSAVVVATSSTRDPRRLITVLCAMATIMVIGYSASVLQAMGAELQAAAGLLGCGVLALLAASLHTPVAPVAIDLALVVHVSWLPVLVHLFRDPERALAARM